MENIAQQIKSQEQQAEKIISDAQEKSKKDLEQAKINQDKMKTKAKENLQKEEEKLIKTAEIEATKEAEKISKSKQVELDKLNKVDINKGVNSVISDILSNKNFEI